MPAQVVRNSSRANHHSERLRGGDRDPTPYGETTLMLNMVGSVVQFRVRPAALLASLIIFERDLVSLAHEGIFHTW